MFHWISQTVAVTLLNLRTIPQRLGSSGVAIIGIAGVVVVLVSVLSIASGFTAAMARGRVAEPRAGDAQRRRQRDDQRRQRHRVGLDPSGARHPPRRPDGAGLLRALRDHRPAEDQHRHGGQRADARHRSADARGARQRLDRRGPHARVRHQRDRRRPRRQRAVPGPHPRQPGALGPEHLERRRHLRGRRRRAAKPRSGATCACCRAPIAAATRTSWWSPGSTRSDTFDTFRDWLTANPQFNVQVRRETEYYAQQSRALSEPDPDGGLRHRRADGHRRGVRRHPHDVHRGVDAVARDRHAARARLQLHLGGGVGDGRIAGPGGHRRGHRRRDRLSWRSTATRPRR